MMQPKLLLTILLQLAILEITASEGPCKVKLKITVTQTPTDEMFSELFLELEPYYHIHRLDPPAGTSSYITHDRKNQHKGIPIRAAQGSDCEGFAKDIWNYVGPTEISFSTCVGDFEVRTTATDHDYASKPDNLWDFTTNFTCDGKEIKGKSCKDNAAAEVKVTCTNEYSYDKIFPAYIQELEKSIEDEKNYKKDLYQNFQTLLGNFSEAYKPEISECIKHDSWIKFGSCQISFFKPILGVIASYAPQSKRSEQAKLEQWTGPAYISRQQDWKKVHGGMARLMKKALSKKRIDTNFFKREMWYTMLHHLNPEHFPLTDSPIAVRWTKNPVTSSQPNNYAEQWYSYAKTENDGKLRELFDVKVDKEVEKFCLNETGTSPLCSFMAARNDYEIAKLSLPKSQLQQPTGPNNPTNAVSVSAYYVENGQYYLLNRELNQYMQTSNIKGAINEFRKTTSEYFRTLASFDKDIATADANYIASAIERNNERLSTNVEKMRRLLKGIDKDTDECKTLNAFETALSVAVGIAGCFAGAAGASVTIQGLTAATKGATFITTMTIMDTTLKSLQQFQGTIGEFAARKQSVSELERSTNEVKDAISRMIAQLKANEQKIEGMSKIVQAVTDGSSLDSIQPEVQEFLQMYNNYTPAVTMADLAELNEGYKSMLDALQEVFKNGGFLCKLAVGSAEGKIGDAKGIWAVIYTIFEEVYNQQSQHINALVKVVRSKLDQSAAKTIAPDVDYEFEITARHMLAVRVAAQQVCDTYQLLNNDKQHPDCKNTENVVFLDQSARRKIEGIDERLQGLLGSLPTKPRYVYIPVVSQGSRADAINWDQLIKGEVVEFTPPANDSSFFQANGWSTFPEDISLIKSLEIYLPNVKPTSAAIDVRFNISAVQENVVVNRMSNTQRYTLKSRYPVGTLSTYKLTADGHASCDNGKFENKLYVGDEVKYCVPEDTGRFGGNLNLPLPLSMYSKFKIQLVNGYGPTSDLPRPFGNTLKLRGRIRYYSDPSSGHRRTLTRTVDSKPPENKYCGEGMYLVIINPVKQVCAPCPTGSVPVAYGSYCTKAADQSG